MATISEFESLDEEVRELIQNYKHKKATVYEPCTLKNIKECLIGLNEELGLLNINYTFNPHVDMDDSNLSFEALVKLINATWTLLHYHKSMKEKADALLEQNHILDHNNKQLNGSLSKIKDKLSSEKNEARACVASAQRVSDRSEELLHMLTETKAKLLKVSKQKEAVDKNHRNEITRLKQENEKLLDKLRNKSNDELKQNLETLRYTNSAANNDKVQEIENAILGAHVSCSEVCDSTLLRLKERERKHLAVISQLQNNNQELLREVLALKEEIILEGIHSFDIRDRKT